MSSQTPVIVVDSDSGDDGVHTEWDVSKCREFGRSNQVARGRYVVDIRRGFDDEAEPLFINEGGFGIAVDVIDTLDPLRTPHVLRISSDEEAFEKLVDISRTVNEALFQKKSPFFLKTRTFFACGSFPALPQSPWENVALAVARKFLGVDYLVNEFSVDRPIKIRLFYLVIERAELFDLSAGPLAVWQAQRSPANKEAHGETGFKRSLCFQLAQGVAALNELGIAHRDVKGANIVLSRRRLAPPSDVFLLRHPMPAERQTQQRIYRVPRYQQIDARTEQEFQEVFDATDRNGYITPHLIDYDFSLRVVSSVPGTALSRSGQGAVRRDDLREATGAVELSVRYPTKRTLGSPTKLAPELLFLSFVGFNEDIDTLFRPDTFSLGVTLGEILTGFSVSALLKRFGFKQQLLEAEQIGDNVDLVLAAYTGFPSVGDIREYRNTFESKVRELRVEAVRLDEDEQISIASIRRRIQVLEQRRVSLDRVLRNGKSDVFKEEFGLSARVFERGALFVFLGRQIRKKKTIRKEAETMLRAMLNWDFQQRPNTAEILTHDFFNVFVEKQTETWTLDVPQTFPVPLRVPSQSPPTARKQPTRRRRLQSVGMQCMQEQCTENANFVLKTDYSLLFCSKQCAAIYWK